MAGVPLAQIIEPAPDSAQFDSESLWQRLRSLDWNGVRVLIVRGDGGRDWLADTLREHGARVDFVSAYSRSAPNWGSDNQPVLDAALLRPDLHVWLFSSSEAIGHLVDRLNDLKLRLPVASRAIATHPKIAARAMDSGFGVVRESRPAIVDVIACIQSLAL
jgi:uroporphyrinogen-III synthase